jgi:organic hydroperoxide reductase OsmC/OhrA
MKRKASAVWTGGIRDGRGKISTDSGVLRDTQYSFSTRFENGAGTNPEELIAAANNAKRGCPVSKVLNAAITMDARLER